MTLARVDLESFEDGTNLEPEGNADFKLGFEAGLAEAKASDTAALGNATQAISTTLADMTFGYTEARVLLLERIRPLLAQVAEVMLPQIAQDSFAAHLVDVLFADFNAATEAPIQISLGPTAIDHISTALSDTSDNYVFVVDPTLVEGQALLKNADTQTMIDLPALTLALQTALNGLDTLKESPSNG